jgi:CSLREA domain-containing protein
MVMPGIGVAAGLVSAAQPAALHAQTTITVNTLTDSSDAAGSCASGACSLRDAITQANSDKAGDTISFSVTGTITLASPLPAIAANMTIQGPGAGNLTVSGNSSSAVGSIFTVSSGTVAINGLTIANGVSVNGGGISTSGVLTLNADAFNGNSATNSGGAIAVSAGAVTVTDSTFSGNSAAGLSAGGAIATLASNNALRVVNSTFSGNSACPASCQGGAIFNGSNTLVVTNSTFSGNSSSLGGAINSWGLEVLLNNIFTGNTATGSGGAIAQSNGTTDAGSNVYWQNLTNGIESDCDNCSSNTNATSGDPKLLPLVNWGGTTETLLPAPGSAAICAGSAANVPSGVTTDQRGFALNSSCVDAGAVQTNYVTATSPLPSSFSGLEDVDLTGLSATVSAAVTISSGEVNLIGPGANRLTLSGQNTNTVITVDSGVQAALYGLTIANGTTSNSGGGINNNGGTVTVINSTISGNSVSGGGAGGGGIFNLTGTMTVINSTISGNSVSGGGEGGGIFSDGSTLTVINSTISGNSAPGSYGGGIFNVGTLTVINSTLSGNSATGGEGGGIFNDGGAMTAINSTISGNSALNGGQGGGIYNVGALNLTNSIVAGNSAANNADIRGSYNDNGGNVINNSAINLAPLGNYGGPTQTMPPLPGSPALNAGTYQTGELATDQRGAPRPSTAGAAIDSGSVQITDQIPVVGSVTPNSGPMSGGTSVTITGTGLAGATGVNFGSTPATSFTVNPGSSTSFASVTAISPAASSPGTVDVTVSGSNGSSTSGQFTYWAPLAISPPGAVLDAISGAAFSQSFTVTGGSGSYTLASAGTPPAGLTLSSSATGWTLSGTPTAAGSASITLTATDNATYPSNTVSQSYTIATPSTPGNRGKSLTSFASLTTTSATVDVFGYGFAPPSGTVELSDLPPGATVGPVTLNTVTATTTLLPQVATSTGANTLPVWTTLGDVNGDGVPDLVTSLYNTDSVSVQLGNGDGTFQPATVIPISAGFGPAEAHLVSLRGNGVLDLIVGSFNVNKIAVLLGNGNGTFAAPAFYTSGSATNWTSSLTWGDFNHDGNVDVAVTNTGDNTVTILLGNGTGTLTSSGSPIAVGTDPEAIRAGDFNGDGFTDLAVANYEDGTVTTLLNNEGGGFTASTLNVGSGPNSGPQALAVTGTGSSLKLAVANYNDNTVSVMTSNGDGTFGAQTAVAVGKGPDDVNFADFNGDGIPDLVVTNYTDSTVDLLLGQSSGSYSLVGPFPVGNSPYSAAVGDLDLDGTPDLVVSNCFSNSTGVLLDGTQIAVPFSGLTFQSGDTILAVYTPIASPYAGSSTSGNVP